LFAHDLLRSFSLAQASQALGAAVVNAVHVTVAGVADVVIASATTPAWDSDRIKEARKDGSALRLRFQL
jgi:hypothetical protein